MASKMRDTKRHRYTYAERTVTAISDIRKHYARNPIHLKTLEARIRKNAEAQNDLLGPRWRTGVNMACKALTDQGILDAEHPPGRIVLTPKGKQVLARARHSLGVSKDHEHDPECNENLGRKVIRRFSVAPERGRSVAPATDEEHTRRNSPSKVTKAELLEEINRLRSEHETYKSESSRKIAELNKELEERDDELLDYRDRVYGFSDLGSNVGDATLVHDASSEQQPTRTTGNEGEEMLMQTDASHPSGNDGAYDAADASANKSLQRVISRSSENLIRTKSGSFISGISKQPTPAPSDGGTESLPGTPMQDSITIEDVTDGDRDDVPRDLDAGDIDFEWRGEADPDVTLTDMDATLGDRSKSTAVVGVGKQILTPTSSPPRKTRRFRSEANGMGDDVTRFSEERSERIQLLKQLNQKGEALKDRDTTIRRLEAHLADRTDLEEQLRALREEQDVAEEKRKVLENEKANLQDSIDRLKSELLKKSTDLENLRDLLQDKSREAAEHASALGTEKSHSSELEGQLLSIRQELSVSMEKTKEAQAELTRVKNELSNEVSETTRLESQLISEHTENMALESSMESLRSELNDAQRELQTEREGATALHEFLREVVSSRDRLSTDLEAKEADLTVTRSTLAKTEAELAILQDQQKSNDSLVKVLQTSLETLRAELRDSAATNELLQRSLQDTEDEVSDIKQGYEKLKRANLTEYEEMDKRVTKKRKRALISGVSTIHTDDSDLVMNGVGSVSDPA